MVVKVKVSNDGEEVFAGDLQDFLADNDNDPEIIELCKPLSTGEADHVYFSYFSGDWIVKLDA